LGRALDFYKAILGEPEIVGAGRASFNLGGTRFILDATKLDGLVRVADKLPNGYATFYVDDLDGQYQRLKKLGIDFLTAVKSRSADRYVIGQDPAENVFVLMERRFETAGEGVPAKPEISTEGYVPKEIVSTIQKLMWSWLKTDPQAIEACLGDKGQWFDDTRLKTLGVAGGPRDVRRVLAESWARYDRGPSGLIAKMEIGSMRAETVGVRDTRVRRRV
jgi:hypothetical protein